MRPYKIEPIFLGAEEGMLEQILQIEALSFPKPLGRASLLSDLASTDTFIDGLFLLLPQENTFVQPKVVGYSILRKFYDEMHMMQIAIHPEVRRLGYGKLLLEHSLHRGRAENCKRFLLEVRVSNQPAIALYKRYRFRIIATRRAYYQDNNEDAFVMERELEQEEETTQA